MDTIIKKKIGLLQSDQARGILQASNIRSQTKKQSNESDATVSEFSGYGLGQKSHNKDLKNFSLSMLAFLRNGPNRRSHEVPQSSSGIGKKTAK